MSIGSSVAPLAGITVLDLTRVLSGPYATMMLGDMGARVIKVEQPRGGDDTRAWGPPFVAGESAYFLSINRNKESLTLDFKHPAGRRVLDSLIARADVLVENFRPGTLQRLGLSYEDLAPKIPRLVYCSISGFGQTGPKRARPGYDAIMQAEGGLMSITGSPEGDPYRLGIAIADIVSGMYAAYGIVLALLTRERTGRGQLVDVAMLDAVASLLTYQASIFFATGQSPPRMGNRHPTIVPYETFDTSDGTIVIAVGNDQQWRKFCEAVGAPALADDPRFATNPGRVANYEALRPMLADRLRSRPADEWHRLLEAAGIPCGAVRSVEEVMNDEQVRARAMVQELTHRAAGLVRLLGVPIKLGETPGAVRTPPPTLGEHTERVLREDVGLTEQEIATLRDEQVI